MHINCSYGFMNHFVEMGAVAMTGFFILSGLVLQFAYAGRDMTDWINYRTFILRRIAGLWPSAILVGVTSCLVAVVLKGWNPLKLLALAPIEILGLSSIFDTLFHVPPNGGLWFVSCVFISYLLFPTFSKMIDGMSLSSRILVIASFICILLYSPLVVKFYRCHSIYSNPIFRFFEFGIGVGLGSILQPITKRQLTCSRIMLLLSASSMVFLVLGVSLLRQNQIGGNDYMLYSWVALPAFIALSATLVLIQFPENSFARTKSVRYCSDLMYAFFLAQFFCFIIVRRIGIESNIFKVVISFVICSLLAIALHEIVQKRAGRALKNYFKV